MLCTMKGGNGSQDSQDFQVPQVPPGRPGKREQPAEEQRHSDKPLGSLVSLPPAQKRALGKNSCLILQKF